MNVVLVSGRVNAELELRNTAFGSIPQGLSALQAGQTSPGRELNTHRWI
jgi:hypothetical protein